MGGQMVDQMADQTTIMIDLKALNHPRIAADCSETSQLSSIADLLLEVLVYCSP